MHASDRRPRPNAPRPLRLLLAVALLGLPLLAHAGVELKVKGVDDPLKSAVIAGVSLSQYGKRDTTEAQVRRLFAEANAQARKALEPYGYFDAHVDGSIHRDGNNWQVTLTIAPGRPVRVTAVDINVDTTAAKLPPVRRAIRNFLPAKGDVLNQQTYTASRDAIAAALTASGYLDARMTMHRVEVTRASHSARVRLTWVVGRRYRFGVVRFRGSQFRPGFLQRYVPFRRGDYFDQNSLLALQQALTAADYFSAVNITPDVSDAHGGTVDIDVELAKAPRTIYTGGPFIGTDTGIGVRAGVERRWVNDRGHKWKNEIVLAQRLKTLSTLYEIPMPGRNQRSLNFGANFRDATTDTSKSRTLELVADESRLWHGWLRTAGVHLLAGTFTVGQRSGEPGNAPGIEHGRSQLVYAEVSLLKKRGANPNFVRHGWSLNLVARSTAGTLLSDTRFSQIEADAKWIDAFAGNNRLILRGSAGATLVGDFAQLPPQLRFFAGGDRSIRGYGYQSIGPRNGYDRVVGGRNLLVASTEVEHYFTRNWGVAAFVDAGNAFTGTHFNPRIGAGLGVRWRSPVGMIRVDFGTPIHDKRRHGIELHLVIGPDL